MTTLLLLALLGGWAPKPSPSADRPQAVESTTESVAVAGARALDFRQGDPASLTDARRTFTDEGWRDFMSQLTGWLDATGAPTYSSSFVASGPPLDLSRADGVLSLSLPGVLTQQSRNAAGGVSTTTYRAEIKIRLVERTRLIDRLTPTTCGGAAIRASCR